MVIEGNANAAVSDPKPPAKPIASRDTAAKVVAKPVVKPAPVPVKKSNPPATKKATTPPPISVPVDKSVMMVHWATWLFNVYRGKLIYSEESNRSELFHCKFGEALPPGTAADCSQFYASCGNAAGIKGFTDTDFTGTLLEKGRLVSNRALWKPGMGVVYGPGDGDHIDMLIAPVNANDPLGDWWIIGFGHSGAPDHGLLSGSEAWFVQNDMPGIRVIDFS